MRNCKYFLIVSLALLLIGCNREWKRSFRKLDKSQLYGNDYDGWELTQQLRREFDMEFAIQKNDHDTLKRLSFSQSNDGKSYVNEYSEIYKCGDLDTCRLVMQDMDTLFWYKFSGDKKTFYQGEYCYRFTHMSLNSEELDYYTLFEDSLRGVRGDNLPRLPQLTKAERIRLDSLLQRK